MGTSSARRNSSSSGWKETARKVAEKNAEEAADIGIKTGLSLLPDGPTKVPVYTAARELYKFSRGVRDKGWIEGTKHYAVGKAGDETGKSIGRAVWNTATGGGTPRGVDPTATRAMQTAFVTACGKIGSKGARAI